MPLKSKTRDSSVFPNWSRIKWCASISSKLCKNHMLSKIYGTLTYEEGFASYQSELSSGLIYDRASIKHQRVPRVVHQAPTEVVPNRKKKSIEKDPDSWVENEFGANLIGTFTLRKALREVQQPWDSLFCGTQHTTARAPVPVRPHLCRLAELRHDKTFTSLNSCELKLSYRREASD